MTAAADSRSATVLALIRQVKPSLADEPISLQDCLVDDLGLDSLDLLQLSRKLVRSVDVSFDLEVWLEAQPARRRSVQSLLDQLAPSGQ